MCGIILIWLVGFFVGDALVAIDACFAGLLSSCVFLARHLILLGGVHRIPSMARAAFARIRGFHFRPDAGGHVPPVLLVFFLGVDGANDFMPDILCGHDFGDHFGNKLFGHVAIGAGGPDARSAFVVRCFFVFFEIDFHGVA